MCRRQLSIDESLGRVMMIVRDWSEGPSGNGTHRIFEDNTRVVAFALALRFDTVLTDGLSFVAFDAAFPARW